MKLNSLQGYKHALPALAHKLVGNVIATACIMGFIMAYVTDGHAACGATINGRPMTVKECIVAKHIYGYVEPGDYLQDSRGNWVKIGNPAIRGNIYLDAQRKKASGGSRHGNESGGLTRTPFGSVGGGYFFDNETGSSHSP